MLEAGKTSQVKAQLLGFLLFGSAHSVHALVAAFGGEAARQSSDSTDELLPGPHPVLRCLLSIHPSKLGS